MTLSKADRMKLVNQMQINQINHLKKNMGAVEPIGQANNYRRRRLRDQNNRNYKNEYDIIKGELSQSNTPVQTRHRLEQRKRMIKEAYDASITAKDVICVYYIIDA